MGKARVLFCRVTEAQEPLSAPEIRLSYIRSLIYCTPVAYHNGSLIKGVSGLWYHYQRGIEHLGSSSDEPKEEPPLYSSEPDRDKLRRLPLPVLHRIVLDNMRSTRQRLKRLKEAEAQAKAQPKSIIKEYILLQRLYSEGRLKPQFRERLDYLHELFQCVTWIERFEPHLEAEAQVEALG